MPAIDRESGETERAAMFAQLLSQIRNLVRFLFALYFLPLFLGLAVLMACPRMGVDVGWFTRDPSSTADIHPLVGAVSNVGVLLWAASATICLFSWTVVRRNPTDTRFSAFLLGSGLMSALLGLDDLFLFHEFIFPYYFGMPEKLVLVIYLCLVLSGLVIFRKCILSTDYLVLLIGLGFFGLSLSIDVVQYAIESVIGGWRILFEDGFKFFGIVGWFGYYSRCCYSAIRDQAGFALRQSNTAPA